MAYFLNRRGDSFVPFRFLLSDSSIPRRAFGFPLHTKLKFKNIFSFYYFL
ncbi:hypothetical protein HMP0721_0396 [Pseudoramibacter alactolyticus ATCC 23263]|uniref:Uncharacterized protein n=1 Tax=Pseudoramibacter alactolyticus ATCC 23263 TaxID=887929 RepID=E6MEG3_9FIRM|nr:hypothetical protein HMP0721_0396 [Pseudoramibacter alactolyticus ATCC 23263]